MVEKPTPAPILTVQDIMRLARKTREAAARLDDLLHELHDLGERAPSDLRQIMEPAMALRKHLFADLAALEKALAEARAR